MIICLLRVCVLFANAMQLVSGLQTVSVGRDCSIGTVVQGGIEAYVLLRVGVRLVC